jgi:hypothetical protein
MTEALRPDAIESVRPPTDSGFRPSNLPWLLTLTPYSAAPAEGETPTQDPMDSERISSPWEAARRMIMNPPRRDGVLTPGEVYTLNPHRLLGFASPKTEAEITKRLSVRGVIETLFR